MSVHLKELRVLRLLILLVVVSKNYILTTDSRVPTCFKSSCRAPFWGLAADIAIAPGIGRQRGGCRRRRHEAAKQTEKTSAKDVQAWPLASFRAIGLHKAITGPFRGLHDAIEGDAEHLQ